MRVKNSKFFRYNPLTAATANVAGDIKRWRAGRKQLKAMAEEAQASKKRTNTKKVTKVTKEAAKSNDALRARRAELRNQRAQIVGSIPQVAASNVEEIRVANANQELDELLAEMKAAIEAQEALNETQAGEIDSLDQELDSVEDLSNRALAAVTKLRESLEDLSLLPEKDGFDWDSLTYAFGEGSDKVNINLLYVGLSMLMMRVTSLYPVKSDWKLNTDDWASAMKVPGQPFFDGHHHLLYCAAGSVVPKDLVEGIMFNWVLYNTVAEHDITFDVTNIDTSGVVASEVNPGQTVVQSKVSAGILVPKMPGTNVTANSAGYTELRGPTIRSPKTLYCVDDTAVSVAQDGSVTVPDGKVMYIQTASRTKMVTSASLKDIVYIGSAVASWGILGKKWGALLTAALPMLRSYLDGTPTGVYAGVDQGAV